MNISRFLVNWTSCKNIIFVEISYCKQGFCSVNFTYSIFLANPVLTYMITGLDNCEDLAWDGGDAINNLVSGRLGAISAFPSSTRHHFWSGNWFFEPTGFQCVRPIASSRVKLYLLNFNFVEQIEEPIFQLLGRFDYFTSCSCRITVFVYWILLVHIWYNYSS